jgi:hypothetical protein
VPGFAFLLDHLSEVFLAFWIFTTCFLVWVSLFPVFPVTCTLHLASGIFRFGF